MPFGMSAILQSWKQGDYKWINDVIACNIAINIIIIIIISIVLHVTDASLAPKTSQREAQAWGNT